jgi:hypothetical protein
MSRSSFGRDMITPFEDGRTGMRPVQPVRIQRVAERGRVDNENVEFNDGTTCLSDQSCLIRQSNDKVLPSAYLRHQTSASIALRFGMPDSALG